MKFICTQKDLEEHCKKFIVALTNVGGPVKSAALMIQQEWIGIKLSLNQLHPSYGTWLPLVN